MLLNLFSHKYPYDNMHELDLSWIILEVGELRSAVEKFAEIIEKYAEYVERFDEFDEALKKLQIDVSNLEDTVNSFASDISSLKIASNQHASQINYILNALASFESDYESILKIVDIKIRQSEIKTDYKLHELNEAINENYAILANEIKLVRDNLKGLIDSLDIRVTNLENGAGVNGVYNPLTGTRLDLDTNNSHVYVDCARLTEAKDVEIFEANLSDGDINDLHLTDYEMSLFAGIYIFRRERVFSPVTGKRVSIYNALSQLVGLIYNSATDETINDLSEADSYFNNLELTDDEFNKYQFS